MTRFVLLPGLDGTGELFEEFVAETPAGVETTVERFSTEEPATYEGLERWLRPRLESDEPFWLLAESYSGPLAARLAADPPRGLRGLVLAVSFVRSPRPLWLRIIPWSRVSRWRIPDLGYRWAMAGLRAPRSRVETLRALRRRVDSRVFATRLRELATVDESEAFRRSRLPVLYLQGRWDRLVLRRSARLVRRLRPDTRVVRLDAPHLLLQTRPRKAWEVITRFVADVEADGSGNARLLAGAATDVQGVLPTPGEEEAQEPGREQQG